MNNTVSFLCFTCDLYFGSVPNDATVYAAIPDSITRSSLIKVYGEVEMCDTCADEMGIDRSDRHDLPE